MSGYSVLSPFKLKVGTPVTPNFLLWKCS